MFQTLAVEDSFTSSREGESLIELGISETLAAKFGRTVFKLTMLPRSQKLELLL